LTGRFWTLARLACQAVATLAAENGAVFRLLLSLDMGRSGFPLMSHNQRLSAACVHT
jgi:hypothetical protein